jgi:hypothetical protein
MKTMKSVLAGPVLAMWIIAASGHAQTYTFRNVAGAPGPSGGSADGSNGNARFEFPEGIATDNQGNLYVADQINYTVRKVIPVGTNWVVSTIAGLAGHYNSVRVQDGTNSSALFNEPTGIAVDVNGNLFVADAGNHAIRKVTPLTGTTNWVVTTIAGQGPNHPGQADGTNTAAQFFGPTGVALDTNGNIFVADQNNNTIRKITPVAGTTNWVVTTLAGQGPNGPGSADGTNKAAQFYYPAGVAVAPNGNLFVADEANNEIRKMTPSGTNWIVSTIAGTKVGSVFNNPSGVAVDTNGNVYVADQYNDTIHKLTPVVNSWFLTTIGGQTQSNGISNGAGTNALFNAPFGLTVDGKGSVFVADTDNNCIRIGYLPPSILTAAPPFGVSQGQFGFELTGPTGQLVLVEASSNLLAWFPVWTNAFGYGPLLFTNGFSASAPGLFYRAHLP